MAHTRTEEQAILDAMAERLPKVIEHYAIKLVMKELRAALRASAVIPEKDDDQNTEPNWREFSDGYEKVLARSGQSGRSTADPRADVRARIVAAGEAASIAAYGIKPSLEAGQLAAAGETLRIFKERLQHLDAVGKHALRHAPSDVAFGETAGVREAIRELESMLAALGEDTTP